MPHSGTAHLQYGYPDVRTFLTVFPMKTSTVCTHYAIMALVYVVILVNYEMSVQEMVRWIRLIHLYHSKNLVVNSGYRTVCDDDWACPHIKDNGYFR